jgi:hypothetical protein
MWSARLTPGAEELAREFGRSRSRSRRVSPWIWETPQSQESGASQSQWQVELRAYFEGVSHRSFNAASSS